MPALLTQQFYVFRDGEQPVGLARSLGEDPTRWASASWPPA